jgi:multidrug efflux system outer membrane protein
MTCRRLLLLVLTAVSLAGCTLIPDYARPQAPVPAGWPSGPSYREPGPARQAPIGAEIPWRRFFTDGRLQTLIAMALQNNRDLRQAALNVERARALYRIQQAELLPTVDAVGSGGRERVPEDLATDGRHRTVEQYRATLGIASWEIDFFGRIRSLEQRALEEYLATEQALRSARILLVAEVAYAFLAVAAERENLQLARFTLEAQQASYHVIRRRFEVGLAPALDLRQVQTRVDAARVDVARYTELAARAENALNLVVGMPVAAGLLPEGLSGVAPLPDLSAGTSSAVLLERPDVLQAENLLQAANADIGAARAALFPRITLTAAAGTASSELSGLFTAGSGTWNFTPRVEMPIFDPRVWSAIEVSEVQRKIALARYEAAIQSAFREVADALARRGTIEDQVAAQRSLVEATAETYRLSNARYEKGSDIFLNVLDAQRSLYSAQQGLIAIQLIKLVNQVRLYTVLGGGAA